MNGERALWCAVMEQALTDAFYRPTPKKVDRQKPPKHPRWLLDRQSAREWLTGNSKDFREVCSLADMDPDAVLGQMQVYAARGWLVDDHVKQRLIRFQIRP